MRAFLFGATLACSGCLGLLDADLDALHARENADGTSGTPDGGDASSSPDGADARTTTSAAPRVTIAVGLHHACATSSTGTLYCWGSNVHGQLGNNTLGKSAAPTAVGLPNVVDVTAGNDTTCAVSNETLSCWGNVRFDGVGVVTSPTAIPEVPGAVSARIAEAGTHACAADRSGRVFCWGDNRAGELGVYLADPERLPLPVASFASGVQAVSLGSMFSCALVSNAVSCWGANSQGVLARDLAQVPTSIAPLGISFGEAADGMAAIAAGRLHACAMTIAGEVHCWGSHGEGQLGPRADALTIGLPAPYLTAPVKVEGLATRIVAIASGASHVCALTEEGTPFCWGANRSGQLGRDGLTRSSLPLAIEALAREVTAIDAGGDRTCARTRDGAIFCWGSEVDASATTDAGAAGASSRPIRVIFP